MEEQKITKDMIIAEILQIDQDLIPVLLNAGMHCVGFQNPLSGGQDLSKADLVIHSMSELLQCLKKRIL